MKINWDLPALRSGFGGSIDKFIGPGATRAEKIIQFCPPLALAIGVVVFGLVHQVGWAFWQYAVIAILAIDMFGGVLTNATSAAKRWYFREGQGFRQHMTFVALHLAQPAVFSWAFLDFNVPWIAGVYSVLLVGSAIILKSPLYLQRPIAAMLYVVTLFLSLYVFENAAYLEWFLPVLFFKILVSHVLREEPYQPE